MELQLTTEDLSRLGIPEDLKEQANRCVEALRRQDWDEGDIWKVLEDVSECPDDFIVPDNDETWSMEDLKQEYGDDAAVQLRELAI